jgi:ABC-type sugar transport system ATPase subunit
MPGLEFVWRVQGPSGSGKTSLLNVLANRLPASAHGTLTGELLVNGCAVNEPPWNRRFARLSA